MNACTELHLEMDHVDRINEVWTALEALSQLMAVSGDEAPRADHISRLLDPHIEVLKRVYLKMREECNRAQEADAQSKGCAK